MNNVDPEQHTADWPLVSFGDVVRNVRETEYDPLAAGLERYVGLEHIEPENLHIKEWGLVAEGTSFTRRFRKGQVLFGKRRAYQRKVAVAEFDGVCSGDILIFESKDDYEAMYLLAKKLGYAERMFKNIKVENNRPSPEDLLREINRGGWSTGYTGQSPERLKAHMRNQSKFDLITLRAPKDDPEVGGDYYGLPWPCWGKPEVRHPGSQMRMM